MANEIGRRNFLKESAGAVAGVAITSSSAPNLMAKADANDTVRAAVVGVRGRGTAHIAGFTGLSKVEVVALCDVDESVLSQRVQELEKKTGRKVRSYTDMRDVLAAKDIDVVSFATPNHWHIETGSGQISGRDQPVMSRADDYDVVCLLFHKFRVAVTYTWQPAKIHRWRRAGTNGHGARIRNRGQSQRDCVYQPRVSEPWVNSAALDFNPESGCGPIKQEPRSRTEGTQKH